MSGKEVTLCFPRSVLLSIMFHGYSRLFFFFLGPHLWHTEVLRLGVKSELQLLAYITAHSTIGSLTTELDQGSDQTRVLMDPSRVR